MTTMSHTPKQRQLWHAGKAARLSNRNPILGFYHSLKKRNFAGANTPPSAKRGIFYAPLKSRK